ncbi:MAG: SIS domain-containing protein [Armatimonadota bacterium]|jgi:glucosamine--fructose-6-phosphate aminotransferase (isomerizing)
MSFMLNEIKEQPDVIGKLVAAESGKVSALAAEIKARGIEYVIMAARGTSDHAAIYGKYLIESKNGLPVGLAASSVYSLYSGKMKMDRALVIGVSQSGQATDVAEYLEKSKAAGALTASITNVDGSTLTKVADHYILCNAGPEKGVAATKTYTSTLAALYLLSATLAGESNAADKLAECAEAMKGALKVESFCKEKAERYRFMQGGYVLSRGYNYPTALEAGLKLMETNYVGMRAYSSADFQHGPIAAVEGQPCFLFAAPGKAMQNMLDIAAKLKEHKAEIAVISSDDKALAAGDVPFKLDVEIDEELSPMSYIIPIQFLAYYLAVTKGLDPDNPRGLSKVTLTR